MSVCSEAHSEALSQSKLLEKMSDDNLISYFKPELQKIGEGAIATKLLSDGTIRNLVRLEVLESTTWSRIGRRLLLTDKGRFLLENR